MDENRGATKLEQAARALRSAIIQGDLRPGQKLIQQELAEWLGMSATPVREVLRILETDGLLEYVPYKGVFVAQVSPDEVEEITPIRVALEALAVRQGVSCLTGEQIEYLDGLLEEMEQAWSEMDLVKLRRGNFRFHSTLYRASGSEHLAGMIERLWPKFGTGVLWMIPNQGQSTLDRHRAIFEAVKAKDADLAAERMAEHIASAGKLIAAFYRKQSTEHAGQSGLPSLSEIGLAS